MSEVFHLASDHAAFEAKKQIKDYLLNKYPDQFEIVDHGTNSEKSCNYAHHAVALAEGIQKSNTRGILLCGSGIGASMVANKFKRVRAALCRSVEEAQLSRLHNDSNVLTLGGRVTPIETMKKMIDIWLETSFEGGRHSERIESFDSLGEE